MAEKTFIVKLAGDSKSYQQSMSQAQKSLDKFQKQNLSSGAAVSTVTSALSKYISVAALAKGAQEVLTRTIQGSQTTADAFAATMYAGKTAVNNFFSSLSTGDFSSFTIGLDTIISQANAAYLALDRLGNAKISWGYFQSANMADLTEYQAIVNDKDLPMEQRQAALQSMKDLREKMRKQAAGYEQRAMEAVARQLTQATAVPWDLVSRENIETILGIDLEEVKVSEDLKWQYKKQYEEYKKKLKQIKPAEVHQYTLNGNVIRNVNEVDKARFDAEVRALSEHYMDAILVNQALIRDTDEELTGLVQMLQGADNAVRSLKTVDRSIRSAENGLKPTSPVVTPVTPMGAPPAFRLGQSAGLAQSTFEPMTKLPEMERSLTNINGVLVDMNGNIMSVTNSAEKMNLAFNAADSMGRAIEHLGSAFSSMDGNAMKSAGGIISTVGAVVQAYTQMAQAAAAASAAEAMAETPTVWGKITAAATVVATVVSTMAQLSSMMKPSSYAEGGIIPGQNYNDGITARVSSGEMIINEADQKRLYDSIHYGGVGGGSVRSSITGEQIVIAVNNYGRRTNRGELVFAGRG